MLRLPDDFQPALLPEHDPDAPIQWFVFAGGNLLVRSVGEGVELPLASIWPFAKLPTKRRLYLGALNGRPCHAAEVEAAAPPPGMRFESLRALWTRLDEKLLGVASHAAQLIEWDRSHQFCGCCGAPTERRADERARHCPACDAMVYPRLSPVVMVRVARDGEILLARAPRFPPGVYSVLAGFVEAGETLEQAIQREVLEEVNVRVRNLRYFASQSWPFPHSLMIAFTADYAGGELRADGREIVDAGWFAPADLPGLPSPMSMAWRLIQDFASRGG
ncbi:MAG TPA: NAD(+) diphosphatase [Candidatus Competibacter sp.]|nr:NAD(+) diphosphatase [Candidatus Competibacteraceae bacterium]HRE53372.1 NAD(+) diphosphatase [Candidatus Competibacter sp.]HUM93939.1 NAD(+) diphosphatase [Candidatus Competibacter sp.]